MPCVLVYGAAGALGQSVVRKYKEQKWTVIAVDLRTSLDADENITISGVRLKEDTEFIVKKLKDSKIELEAVISVAGAFRMETIKEESFFHNLDSMISCNLHSAMAAAHVASHCLKNGGLLVITGANGAFRVPTPTMLSYGVSKAAVHHLVSSLAAPDSGLPAGVTVACILPVMLDTEANRSAMPTANFEDWTPLDVVAQLLHSWSIGKERPYSGSFITIKTEHGKTSFIVNH